MVAKTTMSGSQTTVQSSTSTDFLPTTVEVKPQEAPATERETKYQDVATNEPDTKSQEVPTKTNIKPQDVPTNEEVAQVQSLDEAASNFQPNYLMRIPDGSIYPMDGMGMNGEYIDQMNGKWTKHHTFTRQWINQVGNLKINLTKNVTLPTGEIATFVPFTTPLIFGGQKVLFFCTYSHTRP